MRREKDIRDHKEALRRKAEATKEHKHRKTRAKMRGEHNKRMNRLRKAEEKAKREGVTANRDLSLKRFKTYEDYKCGVKEPVRVCHLIDSLGMGGGQTMMMELVKALNKYYPGQVENTIVCCKSNTAKWEKTFYHSYGLEPITIRDKELSKWLVKRGFNVVLHHRLAVSKCWKHMLPKTVKYILLNHTYHQLAKMPSFIKCDAYISVCEYLHNHTLWPSFIHPSRRFVILNGVENDYLEKIPVADLKGNFITGRCHRMVATKFRADSLTWLDRKASKHIPGLTHYILGYSQEAKRTCKKSTVCHYMGAVNKRAKKMAVIKGLDIYFYETYQNEGASIAVLESLACGVPVLCKDFGGNKELVINGHNGFILKDREDFLLRMKDLAENPDKLRDLKARTLEDFNRRLHIKHTVAKYMQLFEALL